jgi:LysM repeat protein
MHHRSPARLLAPLALAASALAIVLVVTSSGGGDGSSKDGSTTTRSSAKSRRSSGTRKSTTATSPRARAPQRFYVVKPGDILSTISEKTGVPVERIQELNPDVDPHALVSGQRLKLRE